MKKEKKTKNKHSRIKSAKKFTVSRVKSILKNAEKTRKQIQMAQIKANKLKTIYRISLAQELFTMVGDPVFYDGAVWNIQDITPQEIIIKKRGFVLKLERIRFTIQKEVVPYEAMLKHYKEEN